MKVRWPDVLGMIGLCAGAIIVVAMFFYSIPAS